MENFSTSLHYIQDIEEYDNDHHDRDDNDEGEDNYHCYNDGGKVK